MLKLRNMALSNHKVQDRQAETCSVRNLSVNRPTQIVQGVPSTSNREATQLHSPWLGRVVLLRHSAGCSGLARAVETILDTMASSQAIHAEG